MRYPHRAVVKKTRRPFDLAQGRQAVFVGVIACGLVHLVNPRTCKTASESSEQVSNRS
jgi:hypothetical protein